MPVTIDGSNTPTAGGVVYGDGTEYASTAAGTSGQLLQSNGASAPSWVAAPTTSPAGSNTQIQYNNSGAFGASSTLTYDGNVITNTQANGTNSYIRTKSGTVDAYYGAATTGLGTIGVAGTFSNNDLVLYANSAERFRIGTSGQLGIGGATYGTSGQVLTSGGSGAAPTWTTPSAGAMVFISSVTASGATEVEFLSGINSTYDTYMFEITGLYRVSGGTTYLVSQLYSGGAYVAGTNYLTHVTLTDISQTSYQAYAYSNQANARLTNTASIPSGSNANAYNGWATLTGVNVGRANLRTRAMSNGDNTLLDSNTNVYANTITGIKFFLAAGTMNCTIRMYGIAKS